MSQVSTELPTILSDKEFAARLEERKRQQRPELDCWDNKGVRPAPEPSDGLPESTIEQRFPRVADKLKVVWPSEACALYLASLLVNTRETRQGFPKEVVEDLLMLHAINDMLVRASRCPSATAKSVPDTGAYRRRQA